MAGRNVKCYSLLYVDVAAAALWSGSRLVGPGVHIVCNVDWTAAVL